MNVATQRERYLINLELDSMRAEIENTRPTISQVANKISEKLKFKVSYSAIVTACEAIEFTWPSRGHHRYPEKQTEGRAGGTVYTRIKALEARVDSLESIINKLCSELGGL